MRKEGSPGSRTTSFQPLMNARLKLHLPPRRARRELETLQELFSGAEQPPIDEGKGLVSRLISTEEARR